VKVTPLDIRRKEFKRSMRGYADEEVDIFLDEVADEFERLFQENIELQDRVARLEEQIAGHAQIKDALEKTLISAQLQSDEMKVNARKEGELILQEAELKARQIVSDSYSETQRVQQALIQLKRLEEDFRFKFRSLLEGHLQLLSDAPIAAPAAASPVLAAAAVPETEAPFVATMPAAAPVADEVPTEETEGGTRLAEAEGGPPEEELSEREPAVSAVAVTDEVAAPVAAGTVAAETTVTASTAAAVASAAVTGLADDAALSAAEEPSAETLRRAAEAAVDAIEEEPPVHGFFFGRQLEDIDDTFPTQETLKEEKKRDFEW
jgi:cell division initiation protein